MSNFITYGFQVMLIQILFLGVYQIVLHKETFFTWNRFYLLGSVIVSLIVPLITIPSFNQRNQFVQLNEVILSNIKTNEITTTILNQIDTSAVVLNLYFFGILLFFTFFLVKLSKIWKLKSKSKLIIHNKHKIYVLKNSNQAFTFLHFIFIGDDNLEKYTILNHELVHQSKRHSFDLLFLEIIKILFWFNPILILYQNKLAEVHEFEADAEVVQSDKVKYFESMVNQLFQVNNWSITNNFFNQSLIKKRIVMLQKSKSPKKALIKYVLFVPMILLSILLFSNCMENEDTNAPIIYQQNLNEEDQLLEEQSEAAISYERFDNVDEIPRFKDCENTTIQENLACFNEQMNLHIKKNFAYPELAAERNIQGRVSVQFTIDKNGNVTDIWTKGPVNGQLLEEETIRIMKALPQFIPAKLNGKNVNVKYGLPITFKLM